MRLNQSIFWILWVITPSFCESSRSAIGHAIILRGIEKAIETTKKSIVIWICFIEQDGGFRQLYSFNERLFKRALIIGGWFSQCEETIEFR